MAVRAVLSLAMHLARLLSARHDLSFGQWPVAMGFRIIQIAIPTIIRFSVSETKPSGTLL